MNAMSKKVKTVNRCKTLQNGSVLRDVSSVKINMKILVHIGAYTPEIGLNKKNELTTFPFRIDLERSEGANQKSSESSSQKL